MNRPNVLLLLADQERQRDWLPNGLELPNRQRLIDEGLEFTRYYTHTSPCSPSRGTLFTGGYMPVHGVNENCIEPANGELGTDADTLGKVFREQGYYTAYKVKWHLTFEAYPDMDAYGFSDWEGNDKSFWGQAGSGTEFDGLIATSAADWIRDSAPSDQPWFLAAMTRFRRSNSPTKSGSLSCRPTLKTICTPSRTCTDGFSMNQASHVVG